MLHSSGNGVEGAAEGLSALSRLQPGGTTRLYDSMCDAVVSFWQRGDRSRPWVLIVVTDGVDCASTRTAQSTGAYIRQHMTHESSNYCFIVGVGLERDGINAIQTLTRHNESSNFKALPISDFSALQEALLVISIQLVLNVQARSY